MNTITLQHALQTAQHQGLARIDAQMLLLHVMNQPGADRAWLLVHDQDLLSASQWQHFQQVCVQRLDGMPIAYLTGHKEFFGLSLQIDARVLDPRPDTETLVEWALDILAHYTTPHVPSIADLGTGSGAIALALQRHCTHAHILAIDTSAAALEVARANAHSLQLPVRWMQSHWLEQVPLSKGGNFDLIVSNPPYICEDDPHLSALQYEPRTALTSGNDGLMDIRTIITQAPAYLKNNGWLLIEHGWNQAQAVRQLLHATGFGQVCSRQDLAGTERCTGGQWCVR